MLSYLVKGKQSKHKDVARIRTINELLENNTLALKPKEND